MNIKKQAGMSMWGVMMLIIVVVMNAFVALKVGPMYMEYQTVKRVMESVREPLEKERLPNKKVWQSIYRKLIVNNIRDLSRNEFTIKQTGSSSNLAVHYEARKNIFYNIDVIITFDHKMEVIRGSRHGI